MPQFDLFVNLSHLFKKNLINIRKYTEICAHLKLLQEPASRND